MTIHYYVGIVFEFDILHVFQPVPPSIWEDYCGNSQKCDTIDGFTAPI